MTIEKRDESVLPERKREAFHRCLQYAEKQYPEKIVYALRVIKDLYQALLSYAKLLGYESVETMLQAYGFTVPEGTVKGSAAKKIIEVPEGVKTIPGPAFRRADICSVKLPSSLERIDSLAFLHCTALESIEIPENVTYIGSSAFADCTSLKTVKLPEKYRRVIFTCSASFWSLR